MIPTRNHVIANIYCKHGQNHLLAITVIWQKKIQQRLIHMIIIPDLYTTYTTNPLIWWNKLRKEEWQSFKPVPFKGSNRKSCNMYKCNTCIE